jgi:hypothetical protein
MTRTALRLVTGAVAMLGIMAAQLDVRAFAQEPRKDETPVKFSVKIPKTVDLPIVKPAIRWSERSGPATPQDKGSGKKKWILIAAAGAGGAVAVFLLTHKKETPVITVGPPTIGQ